MTDNSDAAAESARSPVVKDLEHRFIHSTCSIIVVTWMVPSSFQQGLTQPFTFGYLRQRRRFGRIFDLPAHEGCSRGVVTSSAWMVGVQSDQLQGRRPGMRFAVIIVVVNLVLPGIPTVCAEDEV